MSRKRVVAAPVEDVPSETAQDPRIVALQAEVSRLNGHLRDVWKMVEWERRLAKDNAEIAEARRRENVWLKSDNHRLAVGDETETPLLIPVDHHEHCICYMRWCEAESQLARGRVVLAAPGTVAPSIT